MVAGYFSVVALEVAIDSWTPSEEYGAEAKPSSDICMALSQFTAVFWLLVGEISTVGPTVRLLRKNSASDLSTVSVMNNSSKSRK